MGKQNGLGHRKRSTRDQIDKFASLIAAGHTQSDAYRLTFPKCVEWQPATIWTKASAFAANEEVQARLAYYRKALEGDREQAVRAWWNHLQKAKDQAFESNNLNALGGLLRTEAQALGVLQGDVTVNVQTVTDAALIERIADGNAAVREHLEQRLPKDGFDA